MLSNELAPSIDEQRSREKSLFLCRWPNSDVSLVLAYDRADAIAALDEFGCVDEGVELTVLLGFLADFTLLQNGHLDLRDFGQDTGYEIMGAAYPVLQESLVSIEAEPDTPEWRREVRVGVGLEKKRNRATGVPPAENSELRHPEVLPRWEKLDSKLLT